ncbi:MAG: isoleucine--tRNA ligase [bacterium]|nr:isoleucine--tRNA ligase [bacterium]
MSRRDYRKTLNLPATAFPMKASLSAREPLALEAWEREGLYRRILERRAGAPRFILHDGPPYANGDIHMGHALNKILKDIVVKYKTMRGFASPFVPGWDCHGLPVEHQLFKELGIGKHEIGRREFRRQASDYALRYVAVQREQFKRLGIFGDWDRPYLTLDPAYQAAIVECFGRLHLGGYVYRGLKPIHWCAACETALAEAEVEYEERESPSVYVAFEAAGIGEALPGAAGAAFLIWTTTPWTIPANRAVAVRPEFRYVAARLGGRTVIAARELLERVAAGIGGGEPVVLAACRGSALEGASAVHPLTGRSVPVVASAHVTLDQGTGCVHIAPGHGEEDYAIGRRCGLEVFAPVDGKGAFTAEAGPYAGLPVEEANGRIAADLRAAGALLGEGRIRHSYPHCWRCRRPVIFRATTQWFLGVDRHDLRRRALEAVRKVRWVPARGENRISAMIEGRPDWCLSRQRYWGVPLPMLYCARCGEAALTAEILSRIVAATAARGADVWFEEPAASFVPPGFACPACGGAAFRKEEDILDVWFDSGVSHEAVLARREELGCPCALYLEGSDQHRGWFQTSLLTAVGLRGDAPYEGVLTHGFITDGEGRKMSKSAGNVISPQRVIEEHGADILRLWAASVDYTADVRISPEIIGHLVDAYRRIRNTFRFLLGNLSDFSPGRDAVPAGRMDEIDRWIMGRLQRLVGGVTGAYEAYDFCRATHELHTFCAVDLSSLYLDVLKDRLYTRGAASPARRSSQTAMRAILDALIRLAAPVLAFTAEEAWRAVPGGEARGSVHLADWPAADPGLVDDALEADWMRLLEVRRRVSKAIEEARRAGLIGTSLEAAVTIDCPDGAALALLRSRERLLPELFIVSRVALRDGRADADGGPAVTVERAPGAKCPRCWRYCTDIAGGGADAVCGRCAAVLERGTND